MTTLASLWPLALILTVLVPAAIGMTVNGILEARDRARSHFRKR